MVFGLFYNHCHNKLSIKGALPQNIFILKTSHIGNKNSLKIMGFKRFLKRNGRINKFNLFLVPKPISPLHVRSKVCLALYHVRSEGCIAPIHVQSKVCQFAPHKGGSNAGFAPLMEGSHADFAPLMEGSDADFALHMDRGVL